MNYTNKLNLPKALERALRHDGYHKNTKYSLTQLLKSPRAVILTERHPDYSQDVSENIWRFIGSAVHSFLEKGEGHSDLTEERLTYTAKCGVTMSGQFDIYSEDEILDDYKVTTKYKVLNSDYEEWQKQLSILAWLLERCGFSVKKIRNVVFLRDWNKQDIEKISDPIQVIEHEKLAEIDGLPIEQWVDNKVEEFEKAQLVADDVLPFCSPEFRWAEPDQYKVFWNESKAEKVRSQKNFDSEHEAKAYCEQLNAEGKGKKTYRVEFVRGNQFKRCDYCNAAAFCNQFQRSAK